MGYVPPPPPIPKPQYGVRGYWNGKDWTYPDEQAKGCLAIRDLKPLGEPMFKWLWRNTLCKLQLHRPSMIWITSEGTISPAGVAHLTGKETIVEGKCVWCNEYLDNGRVTRDKEAIRRVEEKMYPLMEVKA
jgi:hypothetical protein